MFWKVYQWWSLLKCGTWHGWAGANSYPDSLNTGNGQKIPLQRGTRLRRAHTNWTFIDESFEVQYGWGGSLYGLWKVKSRYLVLSATWEAQPWLAGRAQGLAQLISKFAQIHQQIIGGALQRKSGWQLDPWKAAPDWRKKFTLTRTDLKGSFALFKLHTIWTNCISF